jgi:hypothetical protein
MVPGSPLIYEPSWFIVSWTEFAMMQTSPSKGGRNMNEFHPFPLTIAGTAVLQASSMLAASGAPIATWGGSTPWSRQDALNRLIAHIDGGGTWIARRPGEFAYADDAAAPKRKWNYVVIGPYFALWYLFFPHKPPKSASRAFAGATISEIDAIRALEAASLHEVIDCVGGVRIGGRWFFSRADASRFVPAEYLNALAPPNW